ncbi:hypothetical protein JZO76_07425 [Enterococcus sp. MJM12]|uniref:DUF3324 domain-containing protein n=1 Tax=Candidatus Enterococcus myersii TaxID=2815322 RepID=A0ABS3H8Q2_9ENTE|nr:hypothetical protein [Enterococcus sp. MJM12]MBO0449369.1 hypothetical protein [Enterococcus sp. MJM12]
MSENVKVKIIVSEDISNIQNSPANSNIVVINPLLILRAPFVPTALSLAITILSTGITANEEHEMSISILSPDKHEIYTTGKNKFSVPGMSDNFNFNVDLKNIPFMTEGEYKILFELDQTKYDDTFIIKANQNLTGK